LRLSPRLRLAIYGVFTTLVVTGVVWLVADRFKDGPDGETWQIAAAWLLMAHGGGAMVTLLLLGALGPLHIQRGWRARKNRVAGTGMIAANVVLIVTAFGLYYFGAETLRPWTSDLHIGIGFALPILLAVHVALGRGSRS
jgi:hypothetical protein